MFEVKSRTRWRIVAAAWLLFVGLTFLPEQVFPSLVLRLSLEELVGKSDAAIVGTVVGRSFETSLGVTFTRNVVEIEKCLFGWDLLGGAVVEITTLGGRRGRGVGVHVFGEARFEPGEKFLAFIRFRGGRWRVVGMAQGKMKIVTDEATLAETVLPPDVGGLVRQVEASYVPAAPFLEKPVPLKVFIETILEAAWRLGKK